MGEFSLGIDIGGTFTDLVLLDHASGHLTVAKLLTTYPDPSDGVLEGAGVIVSRSGRSAGDVQRILHGTTLVTNTLIQRQGATTGLLTTEGFKDALEIGREGRYDIYDLWLELPEPIAERRRRLEVAERINPDGSVRVPLNEDDARSSIEALRESGAEAVAISLLHAYANPSHERRLRDLVREVWPEVSITCSHEVAPELREYERTSTTVANAHVQPLADRYLRGLESGLRDLGFSAPLHIMLSNGGSCATDTACTFPIRLVESGPCGGALAAAEWGHRSGLDRVFAFDMGGTTAKAILSEDGSFPITTESEVARVYRFKRGSGLPLLVPVLNMIEIGAGGGSIAHTSALGLPAVGPESAGSSPGPACYAQGGELPTVTDADLVLGYLNADHFLGGSMQLDTDKARVALKTVDHHFAGSTIDAAWGIHRLVNENMANAARVHAAERGVDIRAFGMVATGGAGPVHAVGVAKLLGITQVVITPVAGVGSAFGLLLAPVSFDYVRTFVSRLEDFDLNAVNGLFEEMEVDGQRVVADGGVSEDNVHIERRADMRYVGQGHEIRVDIPSGNLGQDEVEQIQDAFDAAYTTAFGRTCEGVPVEAVHWRVTVSGPKPASTGIEVSSPNGGVSKTPRPVVFDSAEGPVETMVLDRYDLEAGAQHAGPVIVEEAESTTVVPPGWTMAAHDCGALVLVTDGD